MTDSDYERQRKAQIRANNLSAMTRYRESLSKYNDDIREWRKLTPDEQEEMSIQANRRNLRIWSFFLGCGLTYAVYRLYFLERFTDDTLWIYVASFFFVCEAIFILLYNIFGRIARGLVASIIAGGVSFLGMNIFRQSANPPTDHLIIIVVSSCSTIAFLLTVFLYKSSAKPKRPSLPVA